MSKGAMGFRTNEYQEWYKMWMAATELGKQRKKKLHQKFYAKYSIEWNGI